MKRILVLAAVMGVALVLASGAFASALTCTHGSCHPGDLGGPTANGAPSANGGGTLPFTGLGLTGIAAVGGLLLVGGFALQRASRRGR